MGLHRAESSLRAARAITPHARAYELCAVRAALDSRDHRRWHDVFLDAAGAGDCLRRYPQGVPFLRMLILRDPEVHNTVAHQDVLGPDLRPFLTTKLGEEFRTD